MRLSVCILMLLFCLCCSIVAAPKPSTSSAAIKKPAPLLTLEIEPVVPESPTVLNMTMRYEGRYAIKVDEGTLPWGVIHCMILVLAKVNGEVDSSPMLFPLDYESTPIWIEPGDVLKGKLDLRNEFPGLRSKLRESDLILFWSYQLDPINQARLQRVGGWLQLPQIKD